MWRKVEEVGGRFNRRVVERMVLKDRAELSKLKPKSENTFVSHIAETLEDAHAILRKAGLLGHPGKIVADDRGNRRTADLDDELIRGRANTDTYEMVLSLAEKLGFEPYNSDEWFAAIILVYTARARDAIARGDAVDAATQGEMLGEMIAEASLRQNWGEHLEKTKPPRRERGELSQTIEAVLAERGPSRWADVREEIMRRKPELLNNVKDSALEKRVSRISVELFGPKK